MKATASRAKASVRYSFSSIGAWPRTIGLRSVRIRTPTPSGSLDFTPGRAGSMYILAPKRKPIADIKRAVTALLQDFGDGRMALRHATVVARVAGRGFGDHAQMVAVMIMPGQQRRARRRAQRGRVKVGVAQSVRREPVQIRRLNFRAVTTELRITDVVQHEVNHVRRAARRLRRRFPGGF